MFSSLIIISRQKKKKKRQHWVSRDYYKHGHVLLGITAVVHTYWGSFWKVNWWVTFGTRRFWVIVHWPVRKQVTVHALSSLPLEISVVIILGFKSCTVLWTIHPANRAQESVIFGAYWKWPRVMRVPELSGSNVSQYGPSSRRLCLRDSEITQINIFAFMSPGNTDIQRSSTISFWWFWFF